MVPQGTVLGFDFGVKRIGVALGNTLTASAHAHCVIDGTTKPLKSSSVSGSRWFWSAVFRGTPTARRTK